MADTEATPKGSAATDNPSEWLNNRLDAKAAPASEPANAEPTVAEPGEEPKPASWRDTPIGEDVDHGFFRGKKVGDLYQSYRHVETAKQQAERERNEYKQELEKLRRERDAEVAARKVASERQVEPGEDPRLKQVDELWFVDNARAKSLLLEIQREQAEKIADAKLAKFREENEQKEWQRQVKEAGGKAYDDARSQLGLDPDTWNLKANGVYALLTNPQSKYYGDGYNIFRPEAIVTLYRELYGSPAPAQVVVKPAPELPPPPGAKKPGKPAEPEQSVSPLTQEKRDAAARMASLVGIDPDKFVERRSRRQGERRG